MSLKETKIVQIIQINNEIQHMIWKSKHSKCWTIPMKSWKKNSQWLIGISEKKNISGIQYESKESTIIKKKIFELPDLIVWSSGQQLCTNFWNVCTMKDLDKHYKASHPSNPLTG